MAKRRPPHVPRQAQQVKAPAAPATAKLMRAVAFHQRGELSEAETLYREILAQAPKHFDALQLLGTIELQRNNYLAAADLIGRALQINSNVPTVYSNRGVALRGLERHHEALASYDRALELKPDYAEALYNRGNTLWDLRRLEESLASIDRALALRPNYPEALLRRGVILGELNRHDEAVASCDRLLALKPNDVEALIERGVALENLNRREEALASYDRALALNPDNAEALNNRGVTLWNLKRHEEALASINHALACKPEYVDALTNRGSYLRNLKELQDALASCDLALRLRPDYPVALNIRGSILMDLRLPGQALASFERALQLKPDYPDALNSLGEALLELKSYEKAAQSFAKLLERVPDYEFAAGRLLYALMLCCDWTRFESLTETINRDIRAGKKTARPFAYQAIATSPRDLRLCAEIFAAETPCAPTAELETPGRSRGNKIRIGYVAGEFRNQATSILMVGLFELHDKNRFELFAFDNGWDDGSEIRGRINRAFDEIVDITGLSDLQAAKAIRQRQIDILINLNGYFGLGRTGVFGHKPAPIQVNYLGFPATLGLDCIDYILADRHVIPPEHEAYYTEKVAYLPDTYQVNDSKRRIAERTPSRAELNLPEAGFVFCCFNNNYKITPHIFDVWMRLLAKIEGSVLWLLEDNTTASRNLRREAERRAVAPERLIFAPRMQLDEHLARHRVADLFLDTLPYNAHTTASDALWAGLPLVTCEGTTFPGRVAASLLHAVGLPELIARSLEEYEALAVKLATTPTMLSEIKLALARNRTTHALFDTDRCRRHIESAYTTMWERCQRGEAPESFAVPPASK